MNLREFFKKYEPPVYFAYFVTLLIYTVSVTLVSHIAIGFIGHVYINYKDTEYVQELIKLGFDENYFLNMFDIVSFLTILVVIIFIIIFVWSIIHIKLNE